MNDLVLTLQIAGRRVAMPAPAIHSVVELDAVTPVPRSPTFVRGLTALRSSAMTVIDCARALGLAGSPADPNGQRAAVIEDGGHLYALLVDSVEDVAEAHSEPAPVPGDAGTGWHRVGMGMIETGSGPALLIDPVALIAGPSARAA